MPKERSVDLGGCHELQAGIALSCKAVVPKSSRSSAASGFQGRRRQSQIQVDARILALDRTHLHVQIRQVTASLEWLRLQLKAPLLLRLTIAIITLLLPTLLQQAAHAKHKLYCCFVDFKQAFNLVPRDILRNVLKRREIAGRVLTSLQSLYAADKACGFTEDGPSDLIKCSIGVKQGCPISLFSLYLDELETLLEEASEETDCPSLAELLIAVLLFADDIALFSYSPQGLQRQLDILQAFCADGGLKGHVQKTKTMVFEHQKS